MTDSILLISPAKIRLLFHITRKNTPFLALILKNMVIFAAVFHGKNIGHVMTEENTGSFFLGNIELFEEK
jgi:hypothetical protein